MSKSDRTITIVTLQPVEAVKKEGRFVLQPQSREKSKEFLAPVASVAQLETFQNDLDDIVDTLFVSFDKIDKREGGMALDEVEVKLEVTADGKVGIFGTSASVSGSASITLKFKRKA